MAGLHSLLLVVNPTDPTDDGFLGGSNTGKDFWRGLRNGGLAGARSFKQHCQHALVPKFDERMTFTTSPDQTASGTRRTPAVALKNSLYSTMREALRFVDPWLPLSEHLLTDTLGTVPLLVYATRR